jgi:hypothetical protein
MGMAKDSIFNVCHLLHCSYSGFIFPVQRSRIYLNAEHINKKKKPFDFTGWENWAPDVNFALFASYDISDFLSLYRSHLTRAMALTVVFSLVTSWKLSQEARKNSLSRKRICSIYGDE